MIDFEAKRKKAAAMDAKTKQTMATDFAKVKKPITPLMAQLSGGGTRPNIPAPPTMRNDFAPINTNDKNILRTPSALERIGKVATGAAKSSGGGFLNVYDIALRGIDAATPGDAVKINEHAKQAAVAKIEEQLSNPDLPGWRRAILKKRLETARKSITPTDVDKATDNLMAGSAEDIALAKKGLPKAGRVAVDVGVGGLQLLGDVGAGLATGGSALLPMAMRSFGGGAYEAEQEGGNLGQQVAYGAASAGVEMLTEKMFDGLAGAFGKGAADGIVEKVVGKLAKTDAGRTALRTIINAGGEGVEEIVSDAVNPVLRSIYNGQTPIENYKEEDVSDWLYSGLVGTIIGGIGGGANILRGHDALQNDALRQAQDIAQSPVSTTTNTQDVATQPIQPTTIAPSVFEGNLPVETQNATQGAVGLDTNTPKGETYKVTPQTITQNTDGLPQGMGAASPEFAYQERVNQQHSTDTAFTDTERQIEGLRHEDSVHKIVTDVEGIAKAQERLAFDYDGEKADLPNKQDWDKTDTTAAHLVLRDLTETARQSGDYSEVIGWNKMLEAHKSAQGQALQANRQFANTPAKIVADAAETLANIEHQNKPVSERAKKATPAEANKAAKAVDDAVTSAAKEIKRNYEGKRKTGIEGNQAGEPFTFEYEEKVGETVARAVENKVNPKKKSNRTFLKDIANQLKVFANEKLPPAQKSKGLTATERLADYINNSEFYNGAWEEAQQYLRDKYAGNNEMLSKLDEFINSGIGVDGNVNPQNKIFVKALVDSAITSGETKSTIAKQSALGFAEMWKNVSNELIAKTGATGEFADTIRSAAQSYVADVINSTDIDAEKTVNAQIKSVMRDIGETVNRVVTRSAIEKQGVKKSVESMLLSKYGFGDVDAQNVAEVVGNHFDALVEEQAQKRLETMFGKERVAPNMKSFLEKFSELRNLGAFESDKYAQAAADKLFGNLGEGTAVTTKKFQGLLAQISEAADTLDNIPQGDTGSVIELIKSLNVTRHTTGMFNKKTSKSMGKALETASTFKGGEEFLRDVAATQIRNIATDYQKTSPLEAVKSYRVMGMLSKATTIFRNLVSNNIFDPVDALSNDMVVPLDILVSKLTGTRGVPVDKSWLSKAKRQGSVEGALKSFIQVGLDADVTDAQSKYETRSGRTFKMTGNPVERFLSTWAKYENYALQTTDEWQKGGIAAETQRGIDSLKERGLIADDAMQDRATEVARDRTFQADSKAAQMTVGLKNALNQFSIADKQGGEFGVGDLTVPFAKVPANLVTQSWYYSPAGIVEGIVDLGKVLVDAKKGTLTPEAQARAVTKIGKGINGTAGIAMFTALALKGIIKVAGDDDRDKESLERAEGKTGTQFNVSALMRWIDGGSTDWQKDDTLVNIGFLDPINAQMAAGAMIADAYMDDGTVSAKDVTNASVSSVVQAVMDLPATSQVSDLINGYRYSSGDTAGEKAAEAAFKYAGSQASSFLVPNIVRGVATGADNVVRSTYGGSTAENTKASILSGIPFARKTLPASLDGFGRERTYTDSPLLNALNANILPGTVTKYKQDAVGKELERLSEATDSAAMYPSRNAPNAIDDKKLTVDEKRKFQKTAGGKSYDLVSELLKDRGYKKLNDEKKAELVENIMGYAKDTAKREYVGKKYKSNSFEKAYEAEKIGISPADYYMYKTYVKEIDPSGKPTQFENAQAIQKTDLSTQYKGKLWELQNGRPSDKNPFTGALAEKGMAPEESIAIMEEYSKLDEEMESYVKGENGPGKAHVQAAYFLKWLEQRGYNAAERSAIYEVFKVWNNIPVDKPSKKANAYVWANPR